MANPIEQLWRLTFHEPDERQHRANNGEQRFGRGFVAVAERVAGIAATDWRAVTRNCSEPLCDCQSLIRDSLVISDC